MTFLESLHTHRGGLVRLKTALYWYDGKWDHRSMRICLLLDADMKDQSIFPADGCGYEAMNQLPRGRERWGRHFLAAELLIDGMTRWVWIVDKDMETI